MNDIQVGDVVTLRSGGQKWTVEAINSHKATVVCELNGFVQRDQFPLLVLEKVDMEALRNIEQLATDELAKLLKMPSKQLWETVLR